MTDPMNETNPRSRTKRHREVEQLSWSNVDAQLLRFFVASVTDDGAAVLLTKTRDGGTLVVQVLNGNDKLKDYMPSLSEVQQVLNWVLDDLHLLMYSDSGPSKNK